MHLRENVALAPLTTLSIGGPARWLVDTESEDAVLDAVQFARDRSLTLFVLGGGSNLLVSDNGFPGLVLHMALKGVDQHQGLFRVAAGEDWDRFVSLAVGQGYGGIECMAGIPGTVGGTPVQNVGAYGQEVSGSILAVRVLDLRTLRFLELTGKECAFSYRSSIFNSTDRSRYIVTRVDYRLQEDAPPLLAYPDLQNYFASRTANPTLQETASAVRQIRHRKGMLLVPDEPDCRSAGSFFRNPVVPIAVRDRIAALTGAPVPSFPASPESGKQESVKIPAAWLLEKAGFHKGYTLGAAGISTRHTLALINRGGATANDIIALRDQIVSTIETRFGIHLEQEPVWVGRES